MQQPEQVAGLRDPVLRGTKIEQPYGLTAYAEQLASRDPLHINLLSKCMPHKFGYEHILVIGASGSGKSTCINQILQDNLWHVGRGYGHRVFIWDYKRTARRYLESLPLQVPVYHLDPADLRSDGIDWAKELGTDSAAKQFAKQVVAADADRSNQNFVFTANARSILYHVIRTFIKLADGKWDLTDVVEACTSEENLTRVLKMTPKGKAKLKTTLGAKGQRSGVFFSLEEFASDFGPIAAALSKIPPERRITLSDWFEREGVLVLSHYDRYEEALNPFQRWVFGAVQRILLSTPDIPHDGKERTSFFLDELRNTPFAGRDLIKLLNSGRSKGGMVVTGLGSIAGLQDAIGVQKSDEYIEMCKTKIILRLEGTAAEWVSANIFNKQLRMIRKFTEGDGWSESSGVSESRDQDRQSHGSSESSSRSPNQSFSYEPVERPALYPGELKQLPSPRIEGQNGLVVRSFITVEGVAWKECATHMERASFTINEKVKDILLRPKTDFGIDDIEWEAKDLIRLGLVEPEPPKERTTSAFDAMMSGQKKNSETPVSPEDLASDEEDEEDEEDEGWAEEDFLMSHEEGVIEELE